MKMSEALEYIKFELLGQEAGAVKQVPVLAGRPGIGKTESLRALARDIGYELITVQLSAVAPEEFSGIPEFIEAPEDVVAEWSANGIKGGKFTRWSIPELVALANVKAKRVKDAGGKGVVVLLDDIHATDPALERYMFNLFLDKTVGQYKMAENVLLCGAMNDSDEAGFNGMNSAVLDRLAVYSVEFDFDHWYKIMGHQLNTLVAAFLKSHQEYVIGEESTEEVSPSPRSWTELSNLFNHIEKVGGKIKNIKNVAGARVGDKAAAELQRFKVIYEKFDFRDMLNKGKATKIGDDIVDQILAGYMFREVKKKGDSSRLIEIIDSNKDKKIFLSSLGTEIYSLYNIDGGKKLNKEQKAVTDWFINSDDEQLTNILLESMTDTL